MLLKLFFLIFVIGIFSTVMIYEAEGQAIAPTPGDLPPTPGVLPPTPGDLEEITKGPSDTPIQLENCYFDDFGFQVCDQENVSEQKSLASLNANEEASCEDPKKFYVGLSTKRVSRIDRETGAYDMQFWIWFKTTEPKVDFTQTPPQLDSILVNSEKMETTKEIIKPKYYEAKVDGTFFNEFDFSDYPFEKLSLPLIVEPYDNDICETIFLIDEREWTGFDYELGDDISGLKVNSLNIYESIHDYGIAKYSRITSEIILEKPVDATFLQFVFPIILLSGLAVLVMFLRIEVFEKVELNAIFLVSMVFYSQFIKFENSFITTFTTFDGIVSVSYAIFLITIVIPGIQVIKKKLED